MYTLWSCIGCKSTYSGPWKTCRCRRARFSLVYKICSTNECGKFGPCKKGGIGCTILDTKGCTTKKHLMKGLGCPEGHFGEDPELTCVPIDRSQKPPIKDFIAVTALSLLPHHLTRQEVCLSSWKKFGLTIASRNTKKEIEGLKKVYDHLVDIWIEDDDVCTDFKWPTQKIRNLCLSACNLNSDILLINSDIEIYGQQDILFRYLNPDTLTMGLRWNYQGIDVAHSSRFLWGIDAFYMSPEMARTLPSLNLAIGRAVWDYWLPLHFRKHGYDINAVGEPLFFHQDHKQHWSDEDWLLAAKWVNEHYGIDLKPDTTDFRESLPYPPNSQTPKILFHHIAKTAGSSFNNWLKSHYEPGEMWETEGTRGPEHAKHWNYQHNHWIKLITGHGAIHCRNIPDNFTKVTIIRHPVDRLYSYFYHLRKYGSKQSLQEVVEIYTAETHLYRTTDFSRIHVIGSFDHLDALIQKMRQYLLPNEFLQHDNTNTYPVISPEERTFLEVVLQEEIVIYKDLMRTRAITS